MLVREVLGHERRALCMGKDSWGVWSFFSI